MLTKPLEALQGYKIGLLMRIARVNGIDLPERRKEQMVTLLATRLFTPTLVARALAHLSAHEIAVLQRLQATPGEARTAPFKQELVRARIVEDSLERRSTYYSPSGAQKPNTLETVAMRLIEWGLVFTRDSQDGSLIEDAPGSVLWIPDEVRAHLPPLPEVKPRVLAMQFVREGSARTFQRDLYLYWSHLRENPATLTQQLWLRKTDLKTLNDSLQVSSPLTTGVGERDARRLFFMRRLLAELGLVQLKRDTLAVNPTTEFFAQAPAERVKRCFELWQKGRFWNEIFGIPDAKLHSADTPFSLAPDLVVSARAMVLQHVIVLASDEWINIESLIQRLHGLDYEFLIPRNHGKYPGQVIYYHGKPPNPYVSNTLGWVFESIYNEEDGWLRVEREFAIAVLREGLYWLGLIDLGYASETDATTNAAEPSARVRAFRLTDMGRWLLANGPEPKISADAGRVVVQPNFEIYAFDPISDETLAALDLFAERVNAERAIQYRLTRQSIYRGSKRGWALPRILEFLQTVSKAPVPQNVARDLHEWDSLFGRVVIHKHVSVLETTTPAKLDDLLADAHVARVVVGRPTPHVVLLKPGAGSTELVYKTLLSRGQLPARTHTDHPPAAKCLTVSASGELSFKPKLPSVHQYARIEPFSERGENGWRITPNAVQNAIASGWTATAILEALQSLHIGPLPERFDLKIKAWAGYFGEAKLETLTLVQFDSTRILEELLADKEIGSLLKPFYARDSARALAIVAEADIPQLRAQLEKRGVTIREKLN